MQIERLFTAGSLRPEDMMRFVNAAHPDDAEAPPFMVPDSWSLEAVESLRCAIATKVPVTRRPVEENTMPSWLWQRRARGDATAPEKSVMDLFDRVAGAACYNGWKAGLWRNEQTASAFFDEARALLLTRRLVLAPSDMVRLGLDWAYGMECCASPSLHRAPHAATLLLQNETIDSILRGTQPAAHGKWNRFLESSRRQQLTAVQFADTTAEWGTLPTAHQAPRATLNLLAFRQADGNVDVQGLAQASRIAVLLLELLHDTLASGQDAERPLALGFGNLSALLLGLAFPYDSDAARHTAAAVAAIITANAASTSALIASKMGACPAFAGQRETRLRAMHNRLRATFGERNDYDKLSVLPRAIEIGSGADLVLISSARYACEEAIKLVQKHGLRHMQLTTLFSGEEYASLLDSSADGVACEATLVRDYDLGDERFERRAHPSAAMAMEKLGYDQADIHSVCDYIVGYKTLRGAPGLCLADLREKGFDDQAIARLEAYLPNVSHIRQAFTPWVLGRAFCKAALGVQDENLENPSFDLLRHLGFTAKEIELANAFCCGRGNIKGVAEIAPEHAQIFALRDDLAPEAQIKMAAAVQSFVMGDVGLVLDIPAAVTAPARGALVLMAWELGLKSLTLHLDGPPLAAAGAQAQQALVKRQTKRATATPQPALGRKKPVSDSRAAGKTPLAAKRGTSRTTLREKR